MPVLPQARDVPVFLRCMGRFARRDRIPCESRVSTLSKADLALSSFDQLSGSGNGKQDVKSDPSSGYRECSWAVQPQYLLVYASRFIL